MIAAFTERVARRDVHFARHVVARYQERVCPEMGRKAARAHLKEQLRSGRVVVQPEPPPWVRNRAFNRALSRDYIVVGDFACFPLVRNTDGRWVATTCIFRNFSAARDGPARGGR